MTPRQEPRLGLSGEREEAPDAWPPDDDERHAVHDDPREPPPPPERAGAASRRRLPWRLIGAGAVVLVPLLALALWQGAALLTSPGNGGGEIPHFAASTEPYKHRPEDPGGLEIPGQESEVYDGVLLGREDDGMEQLLPEPEEPIDLDAGAPDEAAEPVATIDVAAPAPAVAEGEAAYVDGEPIFTAEQVGALLDEALGPSGAGHPPVPAAKPPVPARTESAPAAPAGPADPVGPADPAPAGAEAESLAFGDVAGALGEQNETAAVPDDTPAPAAPAEPATDGAPAEAGVFRVQLASFRSGEAAQAAWQRLARENDDLFADVEVRVVETVIAGSTFHRLQAGAFPDRLQAVQFCETLQRHRLECLVVAP